MHDEPGRLVDHEQVLVLPDDRAAPAGGATGRGRHLGRQLDLLPALEPEALRARDAVDERARLDRALGRRARAEVRREEAVEPLTAPLSTGTFTAPRRRACGAAACGLRSASDERAEQDRDADDDEAVGEVERRPEPEVDEVGHVVQADPVDEVREAAADQQAERGRQHRVARARAREEDEHPDDGDRGDERHDDVALEKSPKAMPEFCTWWIESGPTTCTDSSSASVLVTTCFVTWSAITAASATAASPAHCQAPARERALGDGDGREPVRRRADPDVAPRGRLSRDARAGRRCRASPTGCARRRSAPIGLPQTSQMP